MIDPSYWQGMAPFAAKDPYANAQTATGAPAGQTVYTTQSSQQSQQQGGDWMQAVIEAQRRQQMESDRQFQIQKQGLENQRAQIAIQRGQAEAQKWYNEQLVKLSQSKLEEDRRQFDVGQVELRRQFDLKMQEEGRRFDLTTAEGRAQYQQTYAENQRQFNAKLALEAGMFDQKMAEDKRQYDLSYDLDNRRLGEDARQYDLSRADQREQFALTHGLDVRKLEESARQYDLTRADERERFAQEIAENRRQFDVTASGYLENGQATLEREKFGNQALFDWTSKAIDLASTPADWIKYKQMTAGVADNAGMIPGLAWTQGGQIGNTAFQGQAQANSLQNVLGQMAVGGQPKLNDPSNGTGFVPPGGQTTLVGQQGAGAVQGNMVTRGQGLPRPGADPSGGTGFVPPNSAEQMVSAQGAPAPQQPTNWAMQAAQMIKPASQLNLSAQERQIYQLADDFGRNPQKAAAGWYEQQDPMTRELIRGAAQAQGHDWSTIMARYNRSRWGGGGSSQAA